MNNRTNLKAWLVILVVLLAVLPGSVRATGTYDNGDGSAGNPFQINTPAQMDEIGQHPEDWDKCFILTADIDLAGYTGTDFHIIGSSGTKFTGVFDGNDHTISNFSYTFTGVSYIGLFRCIGSGGEIKNLGLLNVNVDAAGCNYVGGLVGANYYGTVSNCYATGTVSGDGCVGGLVGHNEGPVSNCYATGNVTGDWCVGGLVGWNNGTVSNCYATGTVTATGNYVGGLVGNNEGTVSSCYATGTVSGVAYVGGLVGWNYGSGAISNCYACGAVTGTSNVGGLVGWNEGTVSNCYATGTVAGDNSVGGLVGENYGTVTSCYATGAVTGTSNVGGLVGCDYIGSYTSCFWDIDVNPGLTGVGNVTDPAGVMGRTTAEMQTQSTFTDYGWDFLGESANGTEEIWTMPPGGGYPVFAYTVIHTLTVQTDPDFIDTVTPPVGDHNFAGWAELSAEQFIDCPEVYNFDHWIGDVEDVNAANTQIFMDSDKTVTAVFLDGRECGDECHPYPDGDVNKDCEVNFLDIAVVANSWLECTKPECD